MKCCWNGSGGQGQRGRGVPRLAFTFPGGALWSGRCFVGLIPVFPAHWPWGGLGSAAHGTMLGLGGCWGVCAGPAWGLWQIPWCWSSLNEASLCFFPPHHLVLMPGKGPDPWGKGRQLLYVSQLSSLWQTPPGGHPTRGLGCSAAWGCPPGKPTCVQDFPPQIDLSFSVFSFFLPFSLLAVTPSPLYHLHPAGGFTGNPEVLPQPPPWECQILAGLCFPEMQRC